ncbi:hypothetical protein MUK42_11910 [Musa troglodytarum]|uniref:Secreted protein n=1 Tax=Musa troglodytarum TaxID=320322 RepID=A0A9E7GY55_9LILI|nr:hypothetical protein MUK42_11910 [Musa troglodytarum]
MILPVPCARCLCLPIAASRLVLLALAIVAEHVATVGLSAGGRTRGASIHGSGAALCRSSGSPPDLLSRAN